MYEVLSLREHWCRSDERILWVCPGKLPFGYDVKGVGKLGGPVHFDATRQWHPKSFANKAANEIGDFALTLLTGGEEIVNTEPSPPNVFVMGRGADCIANRFIEHALSQATEGLWVLTSHRFAWVGKPPEEPAQPTGGSLFGRVASAVRDIAGVPSDDNDVPEDSPYSPGTIGPHAELTAHEIAGFESVSRKVRGANPNKPRYLRISFRDGSALDVNGTGREEKINRMIEMSHGRL